MLTASVFLFFNMGGGEVFVILMAILLLFGSKSIPEFARGLGKGIRQFKDAAGDLQRDIHKGIREVKEQVDLEQKQETDKSDSK